MGHSHGMSGRVPACCVLLSLIVCIGGARADDGQLRVVSVVTPDRVVEFRVEIADTPEERARGLMFREALPENRGMLFVYGTARTVTMWMKNTYIPLDMVFIGDDGIIAHIRQNAPPRSLDAISSGGPVAYVLELNAGVTRRMKIGKGDRVIVGSLPQ